MRLFERSHLRALGPDIGRVRAEVLVGEPNSLLDVGGGDGAVTWAIAQGIPRIAVVEPKAARRVRGAKRRTSIEFLDGTGEKIPAPDDSFDRVISFVAFHHFADQEAALREIRRVLRAKGRLILFEFRPDRAPGRVWRLFAGHTHFLSPEDLSKLVAAAGFTAPRAVETAAGYLVAASR